MITLRFAENGQVKEERIADSEVALDRAAELLTRGHVVMVEVPEPDEPADEAVVLRADGGTQQIGRRPTLKQAQGFVGGYVKLVTGRHPETGVYGQLLVNEEAELRRLPLNERATMYCLGHVLYGDCVWLTGRRRWTS